MIDLAFWAPVLVAGTLAGSSTGMLGAHVVGMRIPFLGLCVAHAALAGAVFGALAGLTGPWLLAPALAVAIVTALALGALPERGGSGQGGIWLGMLFSLMMGLAFLGIGLFDVFGHSKSEVLGLLSGSLNLCRWSDVLVMGGVAAAQAAFTVVFGKELRAILFSRTHAAAAGVPVRPIWTAFLVLASAVLTVNFRIVGGLMIYALMINPAAAAFLLARGYRRTIALAALLGAASGLGGFLLALATDLHTGPMIVLLSTAWVAVAGVVSRIRGRLHGA